MDKKLNIQLHEDDNLELDLDPSDFSNELSIVYEDEKFTILHPNSEIGALYIGQEGKWGMDNEESSRVKNYDKYYIIKEKEGKKRSFLFKDGYSDIFAPSGARYSCATWVATNGTMGLKKWFVSQNFPYITTNLKKKLGADFLGNKKTYTYPNETDPGYNARVKSTQITKIDIKKGTESINDVSGFTNVKSLVFPEGVKRINRYACARLLSLESVYLPDTLQRLGEHAFYGCENLKEVFIPKSVTTVGNSIFSSSMTAPFEYRDWRTHEIIKGGQLVDTNRLTIYCEANSKPSGWDDNWDACQYLNWNNVTKSSEFSHYKVIWGASRPTMNMEEDLELDASYPEFNEDNLSMEYVDALINKYFELEKNSKEYLITPEEEERRRSNCYHPWGHNITNYFVRYRRNEVLLCGETDEEIGHTIDIINLPIKEFKKAIQSVNPSVNLDILEEDLDLEPVNQDTSLQQYFVGPEARCFELIETYKNEKCWFITLSDGQYDTFSGLDEFKDDEYIGGFKTFEEAKKAFLNYNLHDELDMALDVSRDDDYIYFEAHVQLNCITDLHNNEDEDFEWDNEEMIADRGLIYDSENPENNIDEELDIESSTTDLGGYKLSEDNLLDISYLKDANLSKKNYEDLNNLWNAYSHDNEEGQWYIFKVKDNDDFSHEYNTKYPYIIVYQGFEHDRGPDVFRQYLVTGQGVGRVSQELINDLGLTDNIPEIDLSTSKVSTINEDVDLDTNLDLDIASTDGLAQTKTLFEDAKWKVELPINYLGMVKLSQGTSWGFEQEMYNQLDSDADFNPNDDYRNSYWNNYKTYVFTNKEDDTKFIYCSDRWRLPNHRHHRQYSYGWLFDQNGDMPFRGNSWGGAAALEAWLKTVDDVKLQKWACSKWPSGLSELKSTITAEEMVQKLNYTVTYGDEKYLKLKHASHWSDKTLFKAKQLITTVIVPDGTTNIDDYAFSDFSMLSTIKLPTTIKVIGEGAFRDCQSLQNIKLHSGVKTIGGYAFIGCKSLTNINIPATVTSIGDGVFSNCSSLTEIIIPKNVKYLGKNVFIGCNENLKVYCGVENWPEHWETEQRKKYTFSPNDEEIPQVNFIFKNNIVEEELDLEPSPAPTGLEGQADYHQKMKKEAERLGVEITDIHNMYPRRLDSYWNNNFIIKINDRFEIEVYSGGDDYLYEGDKDYCLTENDLESMGIVDDETFYDNVGYDDDKPIQIGDDYSRYCAFRIYDKETGQGYYSYDLGYDDCYSIDEMPTIEEFVKEIFPRFLRDENIDLNNDDTNNNEVTEELEIEPSLDELPEGCLNYLYDEYEDNITRDDYIDLIRSHKYDNNVWSIYANDSRLDPSGSFGNVDEFEGEYTKYNGYFDFDTAYKLFKEMPYEYAEVIYNPLNLDDDDWGDTVVLYREKRIDEDLDLDAGESFKDIVLNKEQKDKLLELLIDLPRIAEEEPEYWNKICKEWILNIWMSDNTPSSNKCKSYIVSLSNDDIYHVPVYWAKIVDKGQTNYIISRLNNKELQNYIDDSNIDRFNIHYFNADNICVSNKFLEDYLDFHPQNAIVDN